MPTTKLTPDGAAIRALRESRGLMPAELAEQVRVSAVHIRCIETGHNTASRVVLHRIALALGVEIGAVTRSVTAEAVA